MQAAIEEHGASGDCVHFAVDHQDAAVHGPYRFHLFPSLQPHVRRCGAETPGQLAGLGVEAVDMAVVGPKEHAVVPDGGWRINSPAGRELP